MVRPSCDVPRILRDARLFPEARVLHQADHSILIVLEVRDARLQLREYPFDELSPVGHRWHGRSTGPVGSRLTGIPGPEPFLISKERDQFPLRVLPLRLMDECEAEAA